MNYLFVTGAPRSGTSMTCQVLDALGVNFGHGIGHGNKANPYGYFEDLNVRHGVIKPWLARIGADSAGQWPLPERNWTPGPGMAAQFRDDMRRTLGKADAYKDPKTLLLWPLVHAAFPDARWLIVRRETEAVARSCHRTRMMHCRDTLDGWREWVRILEGWLDDVEAAVSAMTVWPDPSDARRFREAVNALGLPWNEAAVRSVLHPESWGKVA